MKLSTKFITYQSLLIFFFFLFQIQYSSSIRIFRQEELSKESLIEIMVKIHDVIRVSEGKETLNNNFEIALRMMNIQEISKMIFQNLIKSPDDTKKVYISLLKEKFLIRNNLISNISSIRGLISIFNNNKQTLRDLILIIVSSSKLSQNERKEELLNLYKISDTEEIIQGLENFYKVNKIDLNVIKQRTIRILLNYIDYVMKIKNFNKDSMINFIDDIISKNKNEVDDEMKNRLALHMRGFYYDSIFEFIEEVFIIFDFLLLR